MALDISYKIPDVKGKFINAWVKTKHDIIDLVFQKSQELIATGPYDKGTLLGSGFSYHPDKLTARMGYNAPHAKPVEFGSKPHWAPPFPVYDWCRRKLGLSGPTELSAEHLFAVAFGRLKARSNAERAFAKIYKNIGVNGTPPQPYFRPGVELARPQVGKLYTINLAKVMT
jgi:hypothetical protein